MSHADSPRIPQEIIEQTELAAKLLADNRLSLSTHASRLNDCIITFENWIANLPGKVECEIELEDPVPMPDEPVPYGLVVRIKRDGNNWPVSFGWRPYDEESPNKFTPLREASLELKMQIVPCLPQLVIKMVDVQKDLAGRIASVATEFEQFAKKVGIRKEGK